MRPTQIEQIKNAKYGYILPLTDSRFTVYLDGTGKLERLWPQDSHKGKNADLLPGQIYTKNEKYPAYHFYITGCGFSKTDEICDTLQTVNPKLEIFVLGGTYHHSI